MRGITRKSIVLSYFWTSTVFLVALSLLPAVPATAVASLCGAVLFLVNFGRSSPAFGALAKPLILILLVGAAGSLGHEMHHVLRDVLYAFSPLALLYIGCCIGASEGYRDQFLRAIITCSFIVAALHMSAFVMDPALLTMGAQEIRDQAGPGNAIVTLGLVILVYAKRSPQVVSFCRIVPYPVALVVLLLSLILSFSRTQFVSAILFALAMSGYIGRLNVRKLMLAGLFVGGVVALVAYSGWLPSDGSGDGFTGKLARSMTEIAISDYSDAADINNNWRGFESFQAILSYANAGVVGQVIGQGFGALVDLGFYMPLGESEFRYIPTLHNGYAYVLVKFGLLGILLYAYLYFKLFKAGAALSANPDWHVRFFGRLLVGLTASFIAIMFVVGGIPEAHAPAWIAVIGYVITVANWRQYRLLGLRRMAVQAQ